MQAKSETPFGLRVTGLGRGEAPVVRFSEASVSHLFEETDYTLFIQSKSVAPLRLHHRDPVLIGGLVSSDEGRIHHGVINFGSQVGESRFVVDVNRVPVAAFAVEVFPSKLDYRRDYEALRDDVQDIAADLVLEYLRATSMPGAATRSRSSGRLGWLLLLRHLVDELEQALLYIAQQPQWAAQRIVEEHRADRIRRPDAALRRAITRGRGRGAWQQGTDAGLPVRERLPGARGRYTLDTPEHRWLAARLALLCARLADLHAEEKRRPPSARQQQVCVDLETLHHRLGRLGRLRIFEEATGEPPQDPPWRLLTASGYREAYRACLRLQQGVHLGGGPLALSLKEVHLLYEYWCFLTLVRLVAAQTGHREPLRRLLAVSYQGLRVRLRKGRAQTITFPLADGRRVAMTYNPRFGGPGYLVPQQPDILLTVYQRDGRPRRYVLDAKYRLDASPSYRQRYGLPGPPTEALNTLHRYRDAIQDKQQRPRRAVEQVVALFPYREDDPGLFEKSRHHRMLREIGVGAIPLLPGSTVYLAAWLADVLYERSTGA